MGHSSGNALIRNFSIIAHIDHGKSTLADRLLEFTGAVAPEDMTNQYLDSMDLERERGITIKAQTVRLRYQAKDGRVYVLNLIDTPGHVDFSYEVSRSLAACEGVLLVVDAAQGIEAQTVANLYLALENDLEIIPVINKIDLPAADPERVRSELANSLGLDCSHLVLASAKKGLGTQEVLEAVVRHVPPPAGSARKPLKALIFDSWFDPYRGAVALARIMDGELRRGMRIRFMSSGDIFDVVKIGVFQPGPLEVDSLRAGEVGWLSAGIKEVSQTRVGDTITEEARPTASPLPGFKPLKPMVFAGLYPSDTSTYGPLKDAIAKLKLNDPAFTFEPESSQALGFGFRCGFLGMLHLDIVRERLEREFGLDLIATAPSVAYRVQTRQGGSLLVDSPSKLPSPVEIDHIEEPYVRAAIHVPATAQGAVFALCEERRGIKTGCLYLSPERVLLNYELPLGEIIWDFYDILKSLTHGYGSMDYEFLEWRPSKMVRLDVLVNGQQVDALSIIVHHAKAYTRGRGLVARLKDAIPRQLFEVIVQAAIGGRVLARERLPALGKNVTAKCYGGDITRKRKLREKQKEGKKRLKQVGQVILPQKAFLAVLGEREA
ncbi:MAG: translation elongation factor 4 [Pseudomonadota bacterium]